MNVGVNEGATASGEGDCWIGLGDFVAVRYGEDKEPEIYYGMVIRTVSNQGWEDEDGGQRIHSG